MRNKLYYIAVVLFACSMLVRAQESVVSLKNGITIAVFTKLTPKITHPEPSTLSPQIIADPENEGKVIRSIMDFENKLIYTYSVEVFAAGQNKFRVRVSLETDHVLSRAIAKVNEDRKKKGLAPVKHVFEGFENKNLPKYPDELLVNDGDTIALSILRNPKTGAKVEDLIRVTREKKSKGYFVDLEKPRDFSLNDVQLHFKEARLFINGVMANKKRDGKTQLLSASGSLVALISERGSFLFSAAANGKYNLERRGVVEDNKIIFKHKGKTYKIVSKVPIVEKTGHWNLWVGFRPPLAATKNRRLPWLLPYLTSDDDTSFLWLKRLKRPKRLRRLKTRRSR